MVQKGNIEPRELIRSVYRMLGGGPVEPVPKKQNAPMRPKPDGKVLLVEDNPDNLLTATAILGGEGYAYLAAHDAEEALAKLEDNHDIGLILLDMQLPGISGSELAVRIRRQQDLSHIPLVAVTARAMQGDREEMLNMGCDGYLAKPYDPSQLIEIVKQWINQPAVDPDE